MILGNTGRNFAAGMSGGVAYVYDADGTFEERCNKALVTLEEAERDEVKNLLDKHYLYTGSEKAKNILDNFENEVGKFVKVIPVDYKKVVTVLDEEVKKGTAYEDAMTIAFENVTGKKVEIA